MESTEIGRLRYDYLFAINKYKSKEMGIYYLDKRSHNAHHVAKRAGMIISVDAS